jgi:uncharacterized protein (DUF1501 family)
MNHSVKPDFPSRRDFLRATGQWALAGAAAPFALNLAAIEKAAVAAQDGYKALVCIFLAGGNDYANTVVTYDGPSYQKYAQIRPSIALPRSAIDGTVLKPANALPQGRQYALHPNMRGMADLFNSGALAVLLNVGTLASPLSRAQYEGQWNFVPPRLFSHDDQQAMWQSSRTDDASSGWGAGLNDWAQDVGMQTTSFGCVSLNGDALLLSGARSAQYQVAPSGPIVVDGFGIQPASVGNALRSLIQADRAHPLEKEYNQVVRRAIGLEAQLSDALSSVSVPTAFNTQNPLAQQLKMVAKTIGAAARGGKALSGSKRQVFMVRLGGFDTHDLLLQRHGILMGQLSEAMSQFHAATVAMGVDDSVTTFTASDFGRTLTSNGDGSDHGWGNHHFIMGGAVKGRNFYGSAPPVSIGDDLGNPEDQWHVGQGRLLPSTSVAQYAATLARWFGLDDGHVHHVLPDLVQFGATKDYPKYLDFMAA